MNTVYLNIDISLLFLFIPVIMSNGKKNINVKYIFTEEEAYTAVNEISMVSGKIYLFPLAAFLLIISIFIFSQVSHIPFIKFSSSFYWASFLLIFPVLFLLFAKFTVRKNPDINSEIYWNFTNDNIHNSTKTLNIEFDWSRIYKIHESKKGFLIFIQRKIASWIPKHAFKNENEINDFKSLIIGNKIKHYGFK